MTRSDLLHPLRLLTAAWLAGTVPTLPARTFTSTDGRTLEGEITDADQRTVTITRTTDKRAVKIPLATLTAADLKEIAEWRSAKAMARITVTATKDKLASVSRVTGGSTNADAKDQTWVWVITLKNGSAHPLIGASLNWSQVVERTDRNQSSAAGAAKRLARRGDGTVPVPEIPPFGSVRIKTDPITVQTFKSVSYSTSQNVSGDSVTTVTSYKWDEALSGCSVEISKSNLPPMRWKTGTDPGPAKGNGLPPGR